MQSLAAESDVMAVLKLSTAEQHQNVELLMPFFRADFSLQDYSHTLKAFLGFFEPIEQLLNVAADWPSIGIDFSHRRRAHFLRDDLRILSLSDSDIECLPRCTSLPTVHSLESALGCLYVLQGSTLGGQVIGRELARRFSIDESTGASFFLSHGKRIGEMWKEFCAVVRKQVDSPDRQQLSAKAAKETFSCLENWMRKVSTYA
jgi:heme oxygenase